MWIHNMIIQCMMMMMMWLVVGKVTYCMHVSWIVHENFVCWIHSNVEHLLIDQRNTDYVMFARFTNQSSSNHKFNWKKVIFLIQNKLWKTKTKRKICFFCLTKNLYLITTKCFIIFINFFIVLSFLFIHSEHLTSKI